MSIRKTFKVYKRWWKTRRTLPVISWLRAANHYKSGNYHKAIQLYSKGLRTHPQHPARLCAKLDLAFCLLKVGKFKEAGEELLQCARLSPDSREAQLRLAQYELLTGHSLQAAWTLRKALRVISPDAATSASFLWAALEHGGPGYLIDEANSIAEGIDISSEKDPRNVTRLRAAQARALIARRLYDDARTILTELCSQNQTCFEALVAYAELLFAEGNVPHARQQLRRAIMVSAGHPTPFTHLAESYLRHSPYEDLDSAIQLSLAACQHSGWMSPRAMHILAESYYHIGDKTSALMIANKAKLVGNKLLGSYRDVKSLERLIEHLCQSTLS
ncbi:MAG: hypothetical protein DCC75_13135 [Proteobacteria bacterium]|nr:MAG: hypothetical protein DCC75_13135 [Pseudomonadota bacterium]